MYYNSFLSLLLFSSLCLHAGCGQQNPLNRQAVTGEVFLKGEALETGSIEFHPKNKEGTMSGAVITAGSYSIESHQGLPPGDYIVRIFSADETIEPEEVPGESNKLAVERIPPEFNSESEQTVLVKEGETNKFDFKIP